MTFDSPGDSDRKSSAVIPDIAITGKSGMRSRSAPIRSEPLVLQEDIDDREIEALLLERLQRRHSTGGLDNLEMVDPQHDGDHRANVGLVVNNKNAGHQILRLDRATACREILDFPRNVAAIIPSGGKDLVTRPIHLSALALNWYYVTLS
jgi:hypothetical protein